MFSIMLSPAFGITNILIADDDEDDCILFRDALEVLTVSYRLTIANNGNDLLAILKDEALPLPDLIFLDMNMPLRNGLECLREIKGDSRLKDVPVIMCSTSAQEWAVHMAYELKADMYIRKPEAFFKLKDAIGKVLSINWAQKPRLAKTEFLVG